MCSLMSHSCLLCCVCVWVCGCVCVKMCCLLPIQPSYRCLNLCPVLLFLSEHAEQSNLIAPGPIDLFLSPVIPSSRNDYILTPIAAIIINRDVLLMLMSHGQVSFLVLTCQKWLVSNCCFI